VFAIATAVELRDPYTVGLAPRRQARQGDRGRNGSVSAEVAGIGRATSILDIGKVAISGGVLSRPGLELPGSGVDPAARAG
jgi:response regulator RpfG family c-di-GMP phosphodiesterase